MFTKLTLGAAAVAAVAYFAPLSAAPFNVQQPAANEAGLVQQVQWRHCRYWRNECADRWGWGTNGYYRCLWRHGCGRW